MPGINPFWLCLKYDSLTRIVIVIEWSCMVLLVHTAVNSSSSSITIKLFHPVVLTLVSTKYEELLMN